MASNSEEFRNPAVPTADNDPVSNRDSTLQVRMTPVPAIEGETPYFEPPSLRQRLKFLAFSALAALLLLIGLEVLVRTTSSDQYQLTSSLVPVDFELVYQPDDELFYSPRPNIKVEWLGTRVTTNSHGLRSPEFGPKQPGEFRILNLGESSTFGDRVHDDETYSHFLEKQFQDAGATHVRVLNAGVCAYSSFLSLKYLEQRGLALDPDLITFYHEFADYIPTSNREALVPSSYGMPLTDKQLYESRRPRWYQKLLSYSALYRYINFQIAHLGLRSGLRGHFKEITPGRVPVPDNLHLISTPDGLKALNLPARVPPEDRRENFERLREICQEKNIRLVIIHPSYSESQKHKCDLTEFCEEFQVPMFEAQPFLHPDPKQPAKYYADRWHPNAAGQAAMAQGLFDYLVENKLVSLTPPPDFAGLSQSD